MNDRIDVALPGERSYPILLGNGLLGTPDLLEAYTGNQALVVTNAAVADLYLPQVRRSLVSVDQVDVVEIGDGETFKTLDTYAAILDALIDKRHNRSTTVVALGGGVVGDVAGFAAATYQRGVGLVQIPTTLLALVDSSVGGKTAVNHSAGKNLIGAFHQPRAVIADVGVLATLPEREFRAGLAEVIKYGIIADATFFAWLESHMDDLLSRDPASLVDAIRRSCEIKAQVVADDEREQGRRVILNFGHTFGHAIEAVTAYERFLHGEAVAAGMVMAMDLSVRLGRSTDQDAERVRRLIERSGLATETLDVDVEAMLEAMGMDKKVMDGRLRLIVCDGIGAVSVASDVPEQTLRQAIALGR
ncbi:MAG: 3-dehydroquinate synthase [Gammaproteobacteria bacterium]|nr:3-dehydroquinate synthase [Gammaproteobacteria bacterium]